jgi:hypothetical protein
MTLRRSPEVTFLFDQSVAAQDRVEQILYELKQEAAAREAAAVESPDAPDAPNAPDPAETPAARVPPVTPEE